MVNKYNPFTLTLFYLFLTLGSSFHAPNLFVLFWTGKEWWILRTRRRQRLVMLLLKRTRSQSRQRLHHGYHRHQQHPIPKLILTSTPNSSMAVKRMMKRQIQEEANMSTEDRQHSEMNRFVADLKSTKLKGFSLSLNFFLFRLVFRFKPQTKCAWMVRYVV